MEIKAIVCDVDKTLTNDQIVLNLHAVDAIRCLEAAGLPVILVTARDYLTAGQLAMFMGTCGIVAAENGAVIWSMRGNQQPFLTGKRGRVRRGLKALSESLGDNLTIFPTPGRLCSAVVLRTFDLEQGMSILRESKVKARLLDSSLAYHLVDQDTGKGRGVREVAKLLDIDAENIVAIGDNLNDLEMFEAAGYSICVGNAPQEVKDLVDFSCKASFGEGFIEGVTHALQNFHSHGISELPQDFYYRADTNEKRSI